MRHLLFTAAAILAASSLGAEELVQPSSVAAYAHLNSDFDEQSRAVPEIVEAEWNEELPTVAPNAEALMTPELDGEGLACGEEVECGSLILDGPRRRGRWSVLSELPVLVPSYSTATLGTANDHPFVGPRLSLGWESVAGFGVRGRGWGFNTAADVEQSLSPPLVLVADQLDFSASRLDLDFTKRLPHRTGHILVGASLTAAHMTLRDRYTATTSAFSSPYYSYPYYDDYYFGGYNGFYNPYYYPPNNSDPTLSTQTMQRVSSVYSNGVTTMTYEGGGLVRNRGFGIGLLAEGTHCFYKTPEQDLSIFGRGRVAHLIGEWQSHANSARTEGDSNMAIGEAALGVEYRRHLRRADVALQCAFEVQSWDMTIVDRVNLAGVSVGLGLDW